MYLTVVIEECGDEVQESVKVDDSLMENEIEEFLHGKYGKDKWFAYNIEPE